MGEATAQPYRTERGHFRHQTLPKHIPGFFQFGYRNQVNRSEIVQALSFYHVSNNPFAHGHPMLHKLCPSGSRVWTTASKSSEADYEVVFCPEASTWGEKRRSPRRGAVRLRALDLECPGLSASLCRDGEHLLFTNWAKRRVCVFLMCQPVHWHLSKLLVCKLLVSSYCFLFERNIGAFPVPDIFSKP